MPISYPEPSMSIVLVTPHDWSTLRRVLAALGRQSSRAVLELVLVGLAGRRPQPPPAVLEGFWGSQCLAAKGSVLAAGLAAGVRAARAPVVAFCEDHCFPDSGWAQALIARHREPWAAVGPALANANPATQVSRANFIMKYGPWIRPVKARRPPLLPSHNSSYKRSELLVYGPELERWLVSESALQQDLRRRGRRLYLEPAALAWHLNYSRFWPSARHRVASGRLFAAHRVAAWPLGRRLMYIAGAPLIPLVRLGRIIAHCRRIGQAGRLPALLLPLAGLLGLDALGELLGYALGPGHTAQKVSQRDFERQRFLNPGDRRAWQEALPAQEYREH